ncbi:hypothetical protein B9Z34_00920 [Limnohabitans sp. Hippo3]|nr:hypothetical protein B9Z34_00920 [Limnohabitans sp. Hippo3]
MKGLILVDRATIVGLWVKATTAFIERIDQSCPCDFLTAGLFVSNSFKFVKCTALLFRTPARPGRSGKQWCRVSAQQLIEGRVQVIRRLIEVPTCSKDQGNKQSDKAHDVRVMRM